MDWGSLLGFWRKSATLASAFKCVENNVAAADNDDYAAKRPTFQIGRAHV